jgi:hypothetical protein
MNGTFTRFAELYDEVFDKDGQIQAVGREKCMDLILAAQAINDSEDFGNVKTGFMNPEAIKRLMDSMRNTFEQ